MIEITLVKFKFAIFIFFRNGDKLVEINGVDLQNVTPEMLARMLSEGSPKLVSSCASQRQFCMKVLNEALFVVFF